MSSFLAYATPATEQTKKNTLQHGLLNSQCLSPGLINIFFKS